MTLIPAQAMANAAIAIANSVKEEQTFPSTFVFSSDTNRISRRWRHPSTDIDPFVYIELLRRWHYRRLIGNRRRFLAGRFDCHWACSVEEWPRFGWEWREDRQSSLRSARRTTGEKTFFLDKWNPQMTQPFPLRLQRLRATSNKKQKRFRLDSFKFLSLSLSLFLFSSSRDEGGNKLEAFFSTLVLIPLRIPFEERTPKRKGFFSLLPRHFSFGLRRRRWNHRSMRFISFSEERTKLF